MHLTSIGFNAVNVLLFAAFFLQIWVMVLSLHSKFYSYIWSLPSIDPGAMPSGTSSSRIRAEQSEAALCPILTRKNFLLDIVLGHCLEQFIIITQGMQLHWTPSSESTKDKMCEQSWSVVLNVGFSNPEGFTERFPGVLGWLTKEDCKKISL